jgi:hypothetical protein
MVATEKWFHRHPTIIQLAIEIGSITIKHVAIEILVTFDYQLYNQPFDNRKVLVVDCIVFC